MDHILVLVLSVLIVRSSQLPILTTTDADNSTVTTIVLTTQIENDINHSSGSDSLVTDNHDTTTTDLLAWFRNITLIADKTISTTESSKFTSIPTTLVTEPESNIKTTETTGFTPFLESGDDSNKDVWNWLATKYPIDSIGTDVGYEDYYQDTAVWETYPDETTQVAVVAIWPITQAFFRINWLWCFLVILAAILFFLVPGMYIQVCCNKYYLAYRREKLNKNKTIRGTKEDDMVKVDIIPVQTHHINHEPLYDECCADDINEELPANFLDKKSTNSGSTAPSNNNVVLSEETNGTESISLPSPPSPVYYADTTTSLPEDQNNIKQPLYTANPEENLGNVGSMTSYDTPYPPSDKSEDIQHKHTVIYSVPQKSVTLSSDVFPPRSSPVNVAKDYESEAIITNNDTRVEPPLVRPPKPDNYKVPKRPPKPKQYRIKSTTSSQIKDKRQTRDKRRERKQKDSSPNSKQKAPKKIIVSKPRDDNNDPSDRTTSKTKAANIQELRRKEQLLRQLIKGFQEAEMLQRKLDRTRKWAKEQKGNPKNQENATARSNEPTRTSKRPTKPETRRPGKALSPKSKYPPNKRSGDKPPKYEDVMSESGSAQPKSARQQKLASSKRK